MRGKGVKIRDIAEIAGVSTATVSRALSHPDVVAEPTLRAVMDAVRQTGYRVNQAARNLRRQRTGSVLALVPNLANPFFSQILSGMSSILGPAGYGLLIADTQTGPDPRERLAHHMDSGIADGIVIFDGTLPDKALLRDHRPPVLMACEWSSVPLPTVRVDNQYGAALAIDHLVEAGHRKIGHITGPRGNVLSISRQEGTMAALAARGLTLDPAFVFDGDFSMDSGAFAAQRWLDLTDRPTAVFCASDEMAVGFIGALQHAGVDVPGAVSVIGFDNVDVAGHLSPALTTVRQPRRLIGEEAARVLIQMIDTGAAAAEDKVIPIDLVRRNSVVPLGASGTSHGAKCA